MWFAIFDEEFTKKTFLSEPKHYAIGPRDAYYTFKLLTLTVLKGLLNGLFITLFVYVSLNGFQVGANGKNGSFWVSSSLLYGIVVINANVWIAQRTCTHTWWSTVLLSASILSYFIFYWFESLFPWSGVLYRVFNETMSEGRVWLVLLLACWQNIALDMAIARLSYWIALKREKKAV